MLKKNKYVWPDKRPLFLTPFIALALLVFGVTHTANAQEKGGLKYRYFEKAKAFAFEKQYDSANHYLNKAIEIDDNFLEARAFRVRNYGYQEKTAEAISEAKINFRKDKNFIPTYPALVSVYDWSGQYENALNTAINGLFYAPSNIELLEKKAEMELKLNRKEDSFETCKTLLFYDPTNKYGKELYESLRKDIKKNNVGIIYNLDSYENILGNANALSYYYKRDANKGPWVIRVNQAIRAGSTGFQLEGDWYPKIDNRSYLYLNAGLSSSILFPGFRLGAEYYRELGKGWEGSVGLRYLFFDQGIEPVLATLQLGKYWGNNWFSARTFFAFDNQPTTTKSLILLYRRYISGPDHWFGIIAASGIIPDNTATQAALGLDIVTGEQQYQLRTKRFGLAYQQPFSESVWVRLTLGVGEQEDANTPLSFDSFVWGGIQLNYRF